MTRALQEKVWHDFESWLSLKLSPETLRELALCPLLYVDLLRSYGIHLFSRGHALYEFRHLLVIAQQSFPGLRAFLAPAWLLVTKWQALQPIQHRKPLHFVLFQAMVSLAILKGWLRWAATVVLGFYGIARISEVLRAFRGDLVLPSDQFGPLHLSAFLKVLNPKTNVGERAEFSI